MGLWDDAVVDIGKFNALYAQVERKPHDQATLKKAVSGSLKLLRVAVWASKCLSPEAYAPYSEARRGVSRISKDAAASGEDLRSALDRLKDVTQRVIDSAAPEDFTYSGFHISNPDRFSDELCRKTLEGVDFLVGLFKKRGISNLLKQAVSKVNLLLDSDGASAFFHSGKRELTLNVPELSKGAPGRFIDTFVGETVLHEFGHYIHRNYIRGEAADVWDDPWEGLSQGDPRLDALDIVTDYGKSDKYEDFAETFMLFMAAPGKLTPTAKFRMQRALSVSGLYGKPVIRLAERTAARPIYVDKQGLKTFVQQQLVPDIEKWLRRRPNQADPIGSVRGIAKGRVEVLEADGRQSHSVGVIVNARPSNAKGVAVLGGSAGKEQIDIYMNGALSPSDFLVPTPQTDRMAPLWECTYETCLPYGLYSILIHEVTHAADVFVKGLKYSPSDVLERGEAAWGPYVNDPSEVRAFMQEIVDQTERMARKLRPHAKTNRRLVDMILKTSTTWGLIEKHLNPRNKTRILKAVYDNLDREGLLLEEPSQSRVASGIFVASRFLVGDGGKVEVV